MTICTYGKRCLYGKVVEGEMRLNDLGRIVKEEWESTPQRRQNILLDEFIVMPNHFHAIIVIDRRGVLKYAHKNGNIEEKKNKVVMHYAPTKLKSPSQTLGSVIRGFKSAATTRIKKHLKGRNMIVRQRNYYEHIIRNEIDLNEIREYIQFNPLKWANDRYYR